MGSLIKRNTAVAKRKGSLAVAASIGSAVVLVAVNPILGIVGLAGAAYLGWDWLNFRKRHGLRL